MNSLALRIRWGPGTLCGRYRFRTDLRAVSL